MWSLKGPSGPHPPFGGTQPLAPSLFSGPTCRAYLPCEAGTSGAHRKQHGAARQKRGTPNVAGRNQGLHISESKQTLQTLEEQLASAAAAHALSCFSIFTEVILYAVTCICLKCTIWWVLINISNCVANTKTRQDIFITLEHSLVPPFCCFPLSSLFFLFAVINNYIISMSSVFALIEDIIESYLRILWRFNLVETRQHNLWI